MGFTADLQSAFLQAVFQQLTTLVLQELILVLGLEKELQKLIDTNSTIVAFLRDADERQQTDDAVKNWLDQLRDIAYDVNDVLDDFATEAQRRQLVQFAKVRTSVSVLNPKRIKFRVEMSHKIKELTQRLDDIGKLRSNLGLRKRDQDRSSSDELSQTSSMNSLSFLPLGRDTDKLRIINLLVTSDGAGESVISVIPVLGMGGIGKTTLAQLVYNDEIVGNHFDLTLWVHVSRDFSVNRITKGMIEAIDSSSFDPVSLDGLQKHLRMRLSGKRYLIVLDDVWNEDPREWGKLRAPLLYGARGSKILVTTRNHEVAKVMGTMPPYPLQGLSDDDCWSLICQHALGSNSADMGYIRNEIVNMCKGLPLAAETVGFRLRRETDKRKWGSILRDELWEFSGGDSDISRSIRSSYQNLPPHLKLCFAYTSIFPKGYVFDKKQLVQLWMSQNFLPSERMEAASARGKLMEAAGEDYFDSLVGWSFFQKSHFDCKSNQTKYTIHSVIHDFSQLVSGVECCIVETSKQGTVSNKTRHSSLIYEQWSGSGREMNVFEKLYGCKGLYTLLAICDPLFGLEVPKDIGNKLIYLRTLDLSNSGISQLPETIGNLKHLRYLQLSNNKIESLPNSVGGLYNLQTLGLSNCYALKDLPANTSSLRRLRHLDLHLDYDDVTTSRRSKCDSLTSMPPKIGKLVHLQTLSRFVVGTEKGCGLSELQNLNNLHGELRISNLHLVRNAAEAEGANLMSKAHIQGLELWWSDTSPFNRQAEEVEQKVLLMLRPHANIEELKVVGYRGTSFPSWIGDSSFSNLTSLVITNCKKSVSLPPLGQLPMLKDLYVKGMDSVSMVDCAFCGQEGKSFPALEKLHFEDMPKLQVWCGDEICQLPSLREICQLPSLRELVFKNCRDLRQLTHSLPLLRKLVIEGSPWLLGLPRFPSLHSLDLKASGEWIWESCPNLNSLSSLTISQLPIITLLPGIGGCLTSLRRLEISHCDQLIYLPDNWLPPSLTYIGIRHCRQFRALPPRLKDLEALEDMEIEDCPELSTLPELPKALQYLSISSCLQLSQRYLGHDRREIAGISSVWIDKQEVVSSQSHYTSHYG